MQCHSTFKAGSPLLPSDLARLLQRYWIDAKWAELAQIRRVTDAEGRVLVGKHPDKSDMSGFAIPNFYPGHTEYRSCLIRRFHPEIEYRDGTRCERGKFLQEPGKSHAWFAPNTSPEDLKNPEIRRIIVEGPLKGVCLARLFAEAGDKALIIAINGVANFRGKIGKEPHPDGGYQDVKGVIADFKKVTWRGSDCVIVFDSDAASNRHVAAARWELTRELRRNKASVTWAMLPSGSDENGNPTKLGIDDYLVTFGPDAARRIIESAATPEEADSAAGVLPYRSLEGGGIEWQRPTKDGPIPSRLSNFSARIVREITEVDDIEPLITLEMEAECRGRTYHFLLPAKEFSKMDWPYSRIGADAIVYPGAAAREHLRVAIQLLSGIIRKETVFRSTGWRKINDQWVFLHGGGAVGNQSVSVELEAGMENYYLPAPPDQGTLTEAIRASLRFLDLADRRQTWPLLASAYTAPFSGMIGVDFLLWLHGVTGSRKSTLAALLLCHFGDFQRHSLPGNFTSSANSLERQAFSTKDILFVVDDYAPPPDRKHAAAQEAAAHRLIRAVGDRRGRGRMNADTSLKKSMFPRGLVLVTGEGGAPGHQSSAARCVEVQLRPGNVRLDLLTKAQETDAPRYAEAMAGFIAWIAPRYDDLRSEAESWIRREALHFESSHGRIPEACGKLLFGVWNFLRFAVETGAITAETQTALFAQARQAAFTVAEKSNEHQEAQKPTAIFFDHLQTLLAQGAVFLADRETGESPEHVKPRAIQVGWVDSLRNIVYLLPQAVLAEVKGFAEKLGTNFPFDSRTMGEHFEHEGLLTEKQPGRSTSQIRLGEKKHRVWALRLNDLEGKNIETRENCGDSGDSGDRASQSIEKSDSYFVPALSPQAHKTPMTGDKIENLSPQSLLSPQCSVISSERGDKITPSNSEDTDFVPAVPAVPAKNNTHENFSENSPQPASSNGTPGPRRMRRVTI